MILMVCTIMVLITMTYGFPIEPGDKSVDTANLSIIQLNVYNNVKEHDNYAFEDKIPNILVNTKPEMHTDQVKFNQIKIDIKKNILYTKTLWDLLIKLIQLLKLADTSSKELGKKNMDSSENEVDIDDSLSKVTEDNRNWTTPNHLSEKDQTLFPIFTFPDSENSHSITTNKSYVLTTSLLDEKITKFVPQQKTVTSSMIELPTSNVSTSQNKTNIFTSSTPVMITTACNEPTITTPRLDVNSTEKSVVTSSDNTSILSSVTSTMATTKTHQTKSTERLTTKEDEKTTTINWLKWCQNQCRLGTGGTACDCDIIP